MIGEERPSSATRTLSSNSSSIAIAVASPKTSVIALNPAKSTKAMVELVVSKPRTEAAASSISVRFIRRPPLRPRLQGLTNFSTNSSFGCGGSGVFLSRGSLGLRRNIPSAASLNPAASTSAFRNASSMR